MGKGRPFWGMPEYKRMKYDIEFCTECGQKWKLTFEKTEYKAYYYSLGTWRPAHLGGGDPKALKQHIETRYRKEVREW